MNRKFIAGLFVGLLLTVGGAQAQLAAKKGVTPDEMMKHLNSLFQKGDENANAELLKEADVLAKSKDESFVGLAVRVYQNLDEEKKAEDLSKDILKRFPKGIKARGDALSELRSKEGLSAQEFEQGYNAWLKKYPKETFKDTDRGAYDNAVIELATRYAKEGNTVRVGELLAELENTNSYVPAAYTVGSELNKAEKYNESANILGKAYNTITEALGSGTAGTQARTYSMYQNVIAGLYGEALIKGGSIDKGVEVLETVSAAGGANPTIIQGLATGYAAQGKELDAFLLLQNYIVKNGKSPALVESISPLYTKLNGGIGDVSVYLTSLDFQIKDALVAKYKSEMIKKEAPDFELVDRQGNTVKLSDLKGKNVVLDFWATWCGPCIISFPGMQASVNKYKDADDVEFLFINTWQREENYKELVENFITENNYEFTVLFDEMKDRAKATVTAYEVQGIPTKVFIDKEGFIRFQSAGGSDNVEAIVNEMTTKIDLMREAVDKS